LIGIFSAWVIVFNVGQHIGKEIENVDAIDKLLLQCRKNLLQKIEKTF
jgi:hypothetical protein